MISKSNYPQMKIDQTLLKHILLIRNYYQESEQADELWEFVKNGENLFDFAKILPLSVDPAKFETYSTENKLYAMRSIWNSNSNAMYAHYLDKGQKYGIEFITDGSIYTSLIAQLAKRFPKLELLHINYWKSSGNNYYSNRIVYEAKGEDMRSLSVDTGELSKYLLLKVMWGSMFEDPMAFNISDHTTVFLNEPWERNYVFQNQNGIFYAANVNSIFDLALLRKAVLYSETVEKDQEGKLPGDLVYHRPVPKISEES